MRARPASRCPPGRERGSATAELALTLPVVALVLGALLFAMSAGVAQLRCQDAARVAARAISLGVDPASARGAAAAAAGAGAQVRSEADSGWVAVTVSRELALVGLGSVTVTGSASAPVEPGVWP